MNILDPLNSRNNIGRSISLISKNRLINCFKQTQQYLKNCKFTYSEDEMFTEENKMKCIFKNTYK